jgi:hypothetical protein
MEFNGENDRIPVWTKPENKFYGVSDYGTFNEVPLPYMFN